MVLYSTLVLNDCWQVLLCGIEAHVCLLQTALDLLDYGVDVHVAVDSVSSQRYDIIHSFIIFSV